MTAIPDRVSEFNLSNYETDWSQREYTREVGLRPIEAELIAREFPRPPARVLDIGCGAGRTTVGLHELGYTVVAGDIVETLIEQARTRFPQLDFRVMDARALNVETASFDAALFSYNGIDVLYPETSRLACLREIRRVLKPGGTFVFSSHNFCGAMFSGGFFYLRGYLNAGRFIAQQLTNRVAREWYMRYDDGGGTQYLFSAPPARTVRQLHDCGFDVIEVCGDKGERAPRRLLLRQHHVHFVARARA